MCLVCGVFVSRLFNSFVEGYPEPIQWSSSIFGLFFFFFHFGCVDVRAMTVLEL